MSKKNIVMLAVVLFITISVSVVIISKISNDSSARLLLDKKGVGKIDPSIEEGAAIYLKNISEFKIKDVIDKTIDEELIKKMICDSRFFNATAETSQYYFEKYNEIVNMDIEPYVREYGLSISNITVSKIEKYDFEMNMQVLMAMIVSDSDYFGGEDKAKELSDYVLAFKDFLVENNVDLNNIYKVNFDWKVIVENANVWEEDTELVLSNRNSGLYLIVYKYNDSWYYLPYNQYYIYYITQFFEG